MSELYTPDFDWLLPPKGNVLHHADLTRDRARQCEEMGGIWDEEVAMDCGLVTGSAFIPGILTRLSAMRCPECCRRTGLPYGNGSPKNDDECRRILGMEPR